MAGPSDDYLPVSFAAEAIFKDDVKTVIDDGFQKASDVCTGPAEQACADAGIS